MSWSDKSDVYIELHSMIAHDTFLTLESFLISHSSYNVSVWLSAGLMASPVLCIFKALRFWFLLSGSFSLQCNKWHSLPCLAGMANQLLTRVILSYFSRVQALSLIYINFLGHTIPSVCSLNSSLKSLNLHFILQS